MGLFPVGSAVFGSIILSVTNIIVTLGPAQPAYAIALRVAALGLRGRHLLGVPARLAERRPHAVGIRGDGAVAFAGIAGARVGFGGGAPPVGTRTRIAVAAFAVVLLAIAEMAGRETFAGSSALPSASDCPCRTTTIRHCM